MTEKLSFEVNVKNVMKGQQDNLFYVVRIYTYTRSSRPYRPLLLVPVEGIGWGLQPLFVYNTIQYSAVQ